MALPLLKILTDENVSPRVVSFLRGKGLDVIDVKEKGCVIRKGDVLSELT